MDAPDLKLVRPPRREAGDEARGAAVAIGALALACMLAATVAGADRARQSRSLALAKEALYGVIERGPSDPRVRQQVVELRRQIGQRPLDARARALYAGLLLEMGSGIEDADAPAFHAERAYHLAPVTVPVVKPAAIVMARSGHPERAADMIREMFAYEPPAAAELLLTLEPFLGPEGVDRSLPDTPEAWLAWIVRQRNDGRDEASEARLEEAWRRWPGHVGVLEEIGLRAAKRDDWLRLATVIPPDRELPAEPDAALVWALRARVKAEGGDREGARRDALRALELDGRRGAVLTWAGDALLAAGDAAGARRTWNRALFVLPYDSTGIRLAISVRLARLEDLHGRPADALRAWRSVVEQNPDHREGLRRMAELGGVPPLPVRP